ncbi:glycosyltransferase family 2 protein [Aureibacillus halotolerans]|uniref:Rhamnosyltransferase n=1 Tax=Aureibacillus halotolerans TaxID=1508390 RepID=A0A4R6TZ73_9BACI|nr:glycosyltransferase family 2 protein [Aureibacillus halotolerans]TDQ38646.1 rhamnosyltransferase [Aureibacillus halotolerans]
MIVAVIITYNPEIERLKENINAIIKQVDKTIIIDNSSSNIEQVQSLIKDFNIDMFKNPNNLGIAKAINQGIDYAFKNTYSWILTLDQDSICSENMINEMKNVINNDHLNKNLGIVAPNIIGNNFNISSSINNISNPTTVFTSGSLMNVNMAVSVGGALEKLFIDYVDHEFCLRIKKNGYNIVKISTAQLNHQLGELKKHSFFGRNINTTNHSHIRRYYIYRNFIYVIKRYCIFFPGWCLLELLRKTRGIITIILFEKQRMTKLKYIAKGLKDGLYSKYSRIS